MSFRALLQILVGVSAVFWSGVAVSALAPGTELTLYRFQTQDNYNVAHAAVYEMDNGLWRPKQMGRVRLSNGAPGGSCSTVIDHLQNFSLNVMARVGYIGPSDFVKHASVIKNLFTDQVSFLQLSVPKPRVQIAASAADYPIYKLRQIPDDARPNHQHVIQAGLWVVAGQTMYSRHNDDFKKQHPEAIPYRPLWQSAVPFSLLDPSPADLHLIIQGITPMPWQLDPEVIKNGTLQQNELGFANLDRKKYPLCWELGRAAQEEPEHMEALLEAALTVIDQEIMVTFQSRREDAYLFAHALDAKRARRFKAVGFVELVGAPGVLVAPFNHLTTKYPPGTRSARVTEIREALQNKPDLPDALNILRRIQGYFRAELDVVAPSINIGQRTPIVMHDMSRNYVLLMRLIAQNYGLSMEQAIQFSMNFSKFRHDVTTTTVLEDAIPAAPFMSPFLSEEIVRVTNLDAQLATNPDYIPLVIIGIYNYLKFRYSELHVQDPEQPLKFLNTKVAIQTTLPAVIRAAEELGGIRVHTPRPAPGSKDIYSFVFTIEQIKALMIKYPYVNAAAEHAVAQGFWFFRNLNADPLKF